MEEVKYIPGDLVMTDGTPIGTKKGVVYVVTASYPNKTYTLKDGTVNKGIVTLDALTEEDKMYFDGVTTWVKHIVPIPLTKKFLETNGWEKILLNAYMKENFIEIDYTIMSPQKFFWKPRLGDKVPFEFVHELQHLLFGLGLNSKLKM